MVVSRSQSFLVASLTYATLAFFSFFCLFPFLWMLDTALKPAVEVMSDHPSFLIGAPTLKNFESVLFDSAFLSRFRGQAFR